MAYPHGSEKRNKSNQQNSEQEPTFPARSPRQMSHERWRRDNFGRGKKIVIHPRNPDESGRARSIESILPVRETKPIGPGISRHNNPISEPTFPEPLELFPLARKHNKNENIQCEPD